MVFTQGGKEFVSMLSLFVYVKAKFTDLLAQDVKNDVV